MNLFIEKPTVYLYEKPTGGHERYQFRPFMHRLSFENVYRFKELLRYTFKERYLLTSVT